MSHLARVLGSSAGKLASLALVGLAAWLAYAWTARPIVPTVDSYLATQPAARLAEPGFAIGGKAVRCAEVKLILDPSIDDLALAYPGLIVLNAKYLPRLPDVVGLYAHAHECGHQLHGPDETKADCAAMAIGKREGWLDQGGIEAICAFWKPFAGDSQHLPGPERCAIMQQCFADASKPE